MNLFTEPVQLALLFLYISLLDASFLFVYACAHDTVFNTCSFDLDLSIHACLSLHAVGPEALHSSFDDD